MVGAAAYLATVRGKCALVCGLIEEIDSSKVGESNKIVEKHVKK
jgi:hypothetical protein